MSLSRPSRWSLRARLLAGQLALLAAVCCGIAAVTEVALYRYLVGELDGQLFQIAQRSSMMERRPPPDRPDARPLRPRPGPGPEFLDAPGQPIGMVAVVPESAAPEVMERLTAMNEPAFVIGEIIERKEGGERLVWG